LNALRVCIVGSGPAGLYTAKYLKQSLINRVKKLNITIVDQMPTPYGLVRYGVAPDHPEVKNVTNEFHQMLSQDESFSFLGNIKLGETVSLKQLRELYHLVVLSYGAAYTDNLLGIENETCLKGIVSARDVVNWYNVMPDPHFNVEHIHQKITQWLKDSQDISIIGQGNVALDIARIFSQSPSQLLNKEYDIAYNAYQLLKSVYHSRLITLIGRRGPAQAACTTKELREILNLNRDHVTLFLNQRNKLLVQNALQNQHLSRQTRRLLQVFEQAHLLTDQVLTSPYPKVTFEFLKKPVAFLPAKRDRSHVGGIKCEIMQLQQREDETDFSDAIAVGTGEFDVIPTDMVIRSIGYRSDIGIADVPYDKSGRVINEKGKVSGMEDVYVSGWLKRGATGVILSNIIDAKETVETIVHDLEANEQKFNSAQEKMGDAGLIRIAESKHVPVVRFSQWEAIDKEEERRGAVLGLKRSKIATVNEMIQLANKNSNH
jgi:adrenodoxin-NADP+ reductase